MSFLRWLVLVLCVALFWLDLPPQSYGGTTTAPGSGIPIPLQTWTPVLSRGLPESSNDWEQLVYVHAIQQSVMLSQYHQTNSEPNESLVGYNFDTNSC